MTTETKTRFSEMEMNAAFKRVQNPDDWRAPIDSMIRVNCFAEVDLICDAIEFYTATTPQVFQLTNNTVRITAAGYRAGPAGP